MSGDTLAFQLSDAGHRQLFTKTGYYKVVSVELCMCVAVCLSVVLSVCLLYFFLFALASVSVYDEFVSLLIYWLMHSFLLYVFFFLFCMVG